MDETKKTKPRRSYSTNDLRVPMCLKQIACDGTSLAPAARKRGYCGRCKEAMDRRAARGVK
jgi:hypothetical protein